MSSGAVRFPGGSRGASEAGRGRPVRVQRRIVSQPQAVSARQCVVAPRPRDGTSAMEERAPESGMPTSIARVGRRGAGTTAGTRLDPEAMIGVATRPTGEATAGVEATETADMIAIVEVVIGTVATRAMTVGGEIVKAAAEGTRAGATGIVVVTLEA